MPDPKRKGRPPEDVDYASYLRPGPEQDASTETYWELHPETKPPWDSRWADSTGPEPWYPRPEQEEEMPQERRRRHPPAASSEWDQIVDGVVRRR